MTQLTKDNGDAVLIPETTLEYALGYCHVWKWGWDGHSVPVNSFSDPSIQSPRYLAGVRDAIMEGALDQEKNHLGFKLDRPFWYEKGSA